jgi:molybdate transport system regulatory protein
MTGRRRKPAAKAGAEAAAPPPDGFAVTAELRLAHAGQDLAGARRVALLAGIAREGSLTRAAQAVGLSYKGAWDAIEQMGNLAGEPLVERAVGGRGGGSTRLTARGAQLVAQYGVFAEEHARFVDRLNARAAALRDDAPSGPAALDRPLLERMGMRVSARNQFAGTVIAVRGGAVNDEVELAIIGGLRLVATVTRESREALGLAPGTGAFALVKSSSVLLMTPAEGVRVSARNQFAGTVDRIVRGAVHSEVVLALPGAGHVAAIVTNASVKALGLKRGTPAVAMFKASSVIVGVGG